MAKKIYEEWEKKMFCKLFKIPLDTKPINGRTIAQELGHYRAVREYDYLVKIIKPIVKKVREEERNKKK